MLDANIEFRAYLTKEKGKHILSYELGFVWGAWHNNIPMSHTPQELTARSRFQYHLLYEWDIIEGYNHCLLYVWISHNMIDLRLVSSIHLSIMSLFEAHWHLPLGRTARRSSTACLCLNIYMYLYACNENSLVECET